MAVVVSNTRRMVFTDPRLRPRSDIPPAHHACSRHATAKAVGEGETPKRARLSSQDVLISPELALVDPELRAIALRDLPPIKPYGFLDFTPAAARRPPVLQLSVGVVPSGDGLAGRSRLPVPVAAVLYAISALIQVLVFGALCIAAFALLIALGVWLV